MISLNELSKFGFFEYKSTHDATSVFVNPERQCMLFPNGDGFIPYYGFVFDMDSCYKGIMITDIEQLKEILHIP